eukprot:6184300-Pleurochrysis_carterae.AAC.4
MHVYFVNENIGANTCYQGALDAFAVAKGVPLEQAPCTARTQRTQLFPLFNVATAGGHFQICSFHQALLGCDVGSHVRLIAQSTNFHVVSASALILF